MAAAGVRCPIDWHETLERGAGGAGDRHRQRVPGCSADPAAGVRRRGLARARGRGRCAAAPCGLPPGQRSTRRDRRPAAAAAGSHPRAARRRGRAARPARPARGALSSRSSSTTARPSRPMATRCRPCTGTPRSIRSPPGSADLTAHVQFARLARKARAAGLAADGPMTQAEFLGRLGVAERAARLMAANPKQCRRHRGRRAAPDLAHRHGRAVQGDGGALAEPSADHSLRIVLSAGFDRQEH